MSVCCSRPTTALEENRQRNIHVWSIKAPRKVCIEAKQSLAAHYGEYMIHPVAVTLQCSCPQFDCGSFDTAKNKASVTPFDM